MNPRQDHYENLKSWKFAVFYVIRTIIIMRTEARQKSLSGVRLIQSIPSHIFFKLHCNIFLPSGPRSSNRFLAFRFPNQNFVCTSVQCTPYATLPPCFGFCNDIRRVQITMLHSMNFSPVSRYFLQTFASATRSRTPSLYVLHSMWYQVSYPYKKKVKSLFCEF